MKSLLKFFLALTLLFATTSAFSQVRFGFGTGYSSAMGSDFKDAASGGVNFYAELGYLVTEQIEVGLLYEAGLLASDVEGLDDLSAYTFSPIMLQGKYYFSTNKFQPYAGLGLGMVSLSNSDLEELGFESESNFGFRPTVGFKYGILNLGVSYTNGGKIGEGDAEVGVSSLDVNIGLLFTFGG